MADIFRHHCVSRRPREPRPTEGHVGDRALPNGGVGRSCCEDCAHLRICYNSCRNRHCPKCQAAAAKQWLADRQAELLPVPYFHVVFTLPGPVADIAFQNKTVVYDLLLKTAAETLITIAPAGQARGLKATTPSISAPASGSPPCSTPGDRH